MSLMVKSRSALVAACMFALTGVAIAIRRALERAGPAGLVAALVLSIGTACGPLRSSAEAPALPAPTSALPAPASALPAWASAPAPIAKPARPPGTIVIDIGPMLGKLAALPEDDVPEQIRDWAVYGTLARLGVSAADLAKAMHRTSPMRLQYLDEMVHYDHGRGRRALVGKDTILFYDHDDPDQTATLGRLADRVRMETGDRPARARVFELELDPETAEILARPMPDIPGEALFGAAYGYREATVRDEAGFTAWLSSIDDVTSASVKDGALVVGGRRFPRSRTRGVDADDIAVL
jgi:hypothetical protein